MSLLTVFLSLCFYFVAKLKDLVFYFFYGIVVKVVKFFVVILLYCIDFRIDGIHVSLLDYEVKMMIIYYY